MVPFKDSLKKRLPFGNLKSRHAIAVVLSYLGTTLEVYPLLQKISHTTRAYIFNEKGLKGFLEQASFTAWVMRLGNKGKLDEAAGNVRVEVQKLFKDRTIEQQLEHARKYIPGLYVSYMNYIEDEEKAEACMDYCKTYRVSSPNYSLYI